MRSAYHAALGRKTTGSTPIQTQNTPLEVRAAPVEVGTRLAVPVDVLNLDQILLTLHQFDRSGDITEREV